MKGKKISKLLCLALVLCLCVALFPTAISAADEYDGKTVILYTGNIRGDVDKLPQIAAVKKSYEDAGADVILLDAGNFLQGTRYSAYDAGKTLISLMKQTGYDMLALGRYDFAFGTGVIGTTYHGDLKDYGSLGDFFNSGTPDFYVAGNMKLVAANISGQNNYFFNINVNQTITTDSNISIGVFGLTDSQTVNYSLETNLSGMSFGSADSAASAQVAALSGKDVVIGLSNAGISSVQGAKMINISSDAGFTIGALVIDNATKAVTTENVMLSAADSALSSAVNTWKSKVSYTTPIVNSTVTLNGSTVANRSEETNLGDLWSDAIRWYVTTGRIKADFSDDYKATYNDIYVDNDHVVALWNGGNLREYLNSGEITKTDIQRVLPYPNYISIAYLKGSELLNQLEACAQGLPYSTTTSSACAAFMQVSGIEYTVDTYKTYRAGEAYGTSWYKYAGGENSRRVTITSINGKAFDPNAMYCVVTHDKNSRNGMDVSYILSNPQYDKYNWSTYTKKDVCEIVLEYINVKLGGTVGSDYSEAQNRIKINNTEAAWTNPYGDVSSNAWYFGSVKYATQNRLMYGTATNRFDPEENMTRGMFVTMLYRLAGSPSVEHSLPFSDVASDSYYYDAVAWAVQHKITAGVSETSFAPNTMMTRQEMATFMYRYYGSPSVSGTLSFSDSGQVAAWAKKSVLYCVENKLLVGVSATAFDPFGTATRAMGATVLSRMHVAA